MKRISQYYAPVDDGGSIVPDSDPGGLVEGRNSLDVSTPRTLGQTN